MPAPDAEELLLFRTLFAQTPRVLALVDGPEHRFVLANPACAQHFGRPDLVGKTLGDILPQAEAQRFSARLEAVFESGQPRRDEALPVLVQVLVDDAQAPRHLDMLFQPIFGAEGEVRAVFVEGINATDAYETSEALRFSQAYVHLLLNSSAEAFYAVDSDGVTTLCNATFLRMMGFVREEDAIGRKLHGLIHHTHPDGAHYDVADCPIYRCAARGTPAHVTDELFFRTDGTPVPVEYWARPVDIAGVLSGAICTFIDISARREAEAARREVEDRLRATNADLERQVIERASERGATWKLSPHLLSVMDLEAGRFVRVNPAWTATLGWSEEELTGSPYTLFLHPDDAAASAAGFTELQGGDPVLNFENRYRRRDGEYRWLSWVAVPEDGRIYASARDVTAEKLQAAQLAERTAQRDLIWRNSQDIQVVLDEAGVFQAINPAFSAILGWSPHEVLGRKVFDFVVPEDEAVTGDALQHARQSALPIVENRYRHKDGGFRWISWVAAPEAGHIYASGRHITQEKAAREELAATQEALRQSQKMEAVGQLTGGLAHDFNNLLTGISGSLEMLQTRIGQGRLDAVDRYVNAAQGAAKRAAALTHRLLAFSRRQTLDPKSTDVNRRIFELEYLDRRTVGPAVALEGVGAGGLWPTLGDPNPLENALLNLCINARDAMPDGGRITIETANKWLDERAAGERDLPPGQYISLCVTDTGTGMTPEVIARAFDPFFTTKPLGEGTGLGLSMIYGFARQSGGQVRIYSELGRGTTMCLYLPRDQAPAERRSEAVERAVAPQGDGEVVLVIDDEPTVRMLIGEVLDEAGYTCLEASDGPSGLKILESAARIDLLITDVGLPGGMNGRQIADAARRLRPELKVLFITGYAENAAIGNGHLAVGMEVLTKPFAMDALARRIRSLVQG